MKPFDSNPILAANQKAGPGNLNTEAPPARAGIKLALLMVSGLHLAAGTSRATAPPAIYSTGEKGTMLVTIDAGTGAASVVGSLGLTGAVPLAFAPSGTLYTVAYSFPPGSTAIEQLATVDPTTGQATLVGDPFPVRIGIMPMAVSPSGTIFAAGVSGGFPLQNTLLTINPVTGQPSAVGPLGVGGMMDFAFDSSGELYGSTTSALYRINTTTGAADHIANYSGASGVMGITFDPSGNLYATNFATPSSLFHVDPQSGVATLIGSTGLNQVHSADIMPGPSLPVGDFNGDGVLDAADIDTLSAQVRSPTPQPSFDLNADGMVDDVDRQVWVRDLKKTWFGDADLNGVFDSADLVAVFQTAEYEDGIPGNSTWATGDWNGDADFDSADLVGAFQDGGYELGTRVASVVPEPSGLVLLLAALLMNVPLRKSARLPMWVNCR